MHDVFAEYEGRLAAAREALAPVPRQVGAIVYLSGKWLGLEIFGSERLFARGWKRLSRGYAADALDAAPASDLSSRPEEVLAAVRGACVEPAPAVGVGAEHRIVDDHIEGAALAVDDRVAHLMAFRGRVATRGQGPDS
jgi:hypothetical protein